MRLLLYTGMGITLFSNLLIGLFLELNRRVHSILYQDKANLYYAKREYYLYSLFLALIFACVLIISLQIGIINKIGINLPNNFMSITIGAFSLLIGIGLYYFELLGGVLFEKLKLIFHCSENKLIKGKMNSTRINQKYYNFWILFLLSIIISFFEEFIWRGFLITVLQDYFLLNKCQSILLSSFVFGINHFYFGLQTIIIKSFSGMVLGLLYVLTSNVLYPFISHAIFNIWFWWRLKCLNIGNSH